MSNMTICDVCGQIIKENETRVSINAATCPTAIALPDDEVGCHVVDKSNVYVTGDVCVDCWIANRMAMPKFLRELAVTAEEIAK